MDKNICMLGWLMYDRDDNKIAHITTTGDIDRNIAGNFAQGFIGAMAARFSEHPNEEVSFSVVQPDGRELKLESKLVTREEFETYFNALAALECNSEYCTPCFSYDETIFAVSHVSYVEVKQ